MIETNLTDVNFTYFVFSYFGARFKDSSSMAEFYINKILGSHKNHFNKIFMSLTVRIFNKYIWQTCIASKDIPVYGWKKYSTLFI